MSSSNATVLPPPPPEGVPISPRAAYLAQIYLGSTSILLLLCIITFGMRLYQRMLPVWKVGLDDLFITCGFILSVADWAMLIPLMVPQAGFVSLDYAINTGKMSWLAIGVWGLSMSCIKISIALTLLRIQQKSKPWRIFLFTIMAVQITYGVLNTLFNTVIACRPLAAAWDLVHYPLDSCVSVETMRLASNIGSGINIATDVLLSLAPGIFLRKLNRPLRERIFVCVLMGLGLFATATSIIKTVIVKSWGNPAEIDDFWAMGNAISTYTVLEQFTGILAACIPALKGILQACLGKMGLSLSDSKSRRGYNQSGASGGTGNGTGPNPLQTFGSGHSRYVRGGNDDSIDGDDEKGFHMVITPKSSQGSSSFGEGDFKIGLPTIDRSRLPGYAV